MILHKNAIWILLFFSCLRLGQLTFIQEIYKTSTQHTTQSKYGTNFKKCNVNQSLKGIQRANLLVPSLNTTISTVQCCHIAMFVTEQLNLQMSALQRKNKTKAFRNKYSDIKAQDTKNKGGAKTNN